MASRGRTGVQDNAATTIAVPRPDPGAANGHHTTPPREASESEVACPEPAGRILDRLVFPSVRPHVTQRFGVGLGILLISVGLSWLLCQVADPGTACASVIIGGVLLSTAYGGFRVGIAMTALGVLLYNFLIADEAFANPWDLAAIGTFGLTAAVVGGLYEHAYRYQRRALDFGIERDELLAAVSAGENRWRDLADSMPALVTQSDAQGRLYFQNRRWVEYTGLSPEELRASPTAMAHPDDLRRMTAVWDEAQRTGQPATLEWRLRRADGAYRWHATYCSPLWSADGAIVSWVGASVDIDDSKRAHELVAAQWQQVRLITDSLPVLMSYVDASRRYVFANLIYEEWFGTPREEVIGMRVEDVLGAEAFAKAKPYIDRVLGGETVTFEELIPYTQRGTRFVRATYVPDIADDRTVRGFFVVVSDINEERQAQDALRRSEERTRLALNAAGTGSWEWNIATGEVVRSDRIFDILGISAEQADGVDLFAGLVHPDDREAFDAAWRRSLRDKQDYHLEFRIIRPDGKVRWLEGWGSLILDAAAEPARVIGLTQDITPRRREQARREALATASAEFAAAPMHDIPALLDRIVRNGVAATGGGCTMRLISADGQRLERWATHHDDPKVLAYARETMDKMASTVSEGIGGPVIRTGEPRFIPVIDAGKLEELKARMAPAHRQYADHFATTSLITVQMRSGGQVLGALSVWRGAGAEPYEPTDVAFVQDLADRAAMAIQNARLYGDLQERIVEAQRALDLQQASEERFRMAAPAARMGAWEWDLGDRLLLSGSLEVIYGFEPGTFTGDFGTFLERVHPDDRESIGNHIEEAIAEQRDLDVEHRMIPSPGVERWINCRGHTVSDEKGTPTRMVGICIDVTERKEANLLLERTAEELRRANAAKDEFLSMVSHELKTPITTVMGNAEVLQRRSAMLDEESRMTALADIHRESERLHQIIENLLILARLEQGQLLDTEPLLMIRVAEGVAAEHRVRHPNRELSVLNQPGELVPVNASRVHVEQVLRNLLSNAEKYSPPDDPIEISVDRLSDEVIVSVLDRGPGIPEEERDQIFTAFYRSADLARAAPGIGVGLTVCKRLVEAHGGEIRAEPRDGEGTRFVFSLPALCDDLPY